MCAEINAYPIRKKSGFDISKSRIFAFQKSINAIFNIESNDEILTETRHVLNQRRIKSAPADLTSSGSMTDKDMNAAPEGRFQIFSGLQGRIKPTQDDLWSKSFKVCSDVNIENKVTTSPSNHQETCQLLVKISNNMDNLLHYFNSIHDYPEYYLGKAEKIALCRCPQTGKETWNNGKILLIAEPRKNMIVKAQLKIKDTIYEKEFIFVKWETENFYEWRMKSGNILQLRQQYIDGLLPKDKKYLRMHT
jgi:hypothetical protein